MTLPTPEALRATPSEQAFQSLMRSAVTSDELSDESVDVITDTLASWPKTIRRLVPIDLHEQVGTLCQRWPLYRWTHPLDLLLVPFSADAWRATLNELRDSFGDRSVRTEPDNWPLLDCTEIGDDGPAGQPHPLSLIRHCLTQELGIEPTSLQLSPDELQHLFSGERPREPNSDCPVAFHHGDISITGDLLGRQLPQPYNHITGSLRIDGELKMEPWDDWLLVGGDLECHGGQIERFVVEGTLRGRALRCGENNDHVCVAGAIDAELLILHFAMTPDLRARVLVDGQGFGGLDENPAEEVPRIRSALLPAAEHEALEAVTGLNELESAKYPADVRDDLRRWLESLIPRITRGENLFR